MSKARVLIADAQRVVIEGIRSALRSHPEIEIVDEAHDGHEAVKKAKQLRPDIVIMEIAMPDLNGLDVTLQIRKHNQQVRIVIFTAHSDIEQIVDLFKAGISAYILKESPLPELICAVDAACRNEDYFNPTLKRAMMSRLRTAGEGSGEKDGFDELSLREREVLQMLAEGMSIKDIAKKLDLSPKTVEAHKYRIMQKLNVDSMADLTKVAIKRKLIQP